MKIYHNSFQLKIGVSAAISQSGIQLWLLKVHSLSWGFWGLYEQGCCPQVNAELEENTGLRAGVF